MSFCRNFRFFKCLVIWWLLFWKFLLKMSRRKHAFWKLAAIVSWQILMLLKGSWRISCNRKLGATLINEDFKMNSVINCKHSRKYKQVRKTKKVNMNWKINSKLNSTKYCFSRSNLMLKSGFVYHFNLIFCDFLKLTRFSNSLTLWSFLKSNTDLISTNRHWHYLCLEERCYLGNFNMCAHGLICLHVETLYPICPVYFSDKLWMKHDYYSRVYKYTTWIQWSWSGHVAFVKRKLNSSDLNQAGLL